MDCLVFWRNMVPKLEILWIYFLTVLTGYVVHGGEYCTYRDNRGNNRYIYCDGYCCSSEDDRCCTNYVGLIVGCVIGGIILLAVVITIVVIVCKKHQAKKGRVIQPRHGNTVTHTSVVYSSHFAPVQAPPPYTYTNPYPVVSGPAYLPPPAYPGPPTKNGLPTYTEPHGGTTGPINVNVQPTSQGQTDPAYPPSSS